MILPFQVQKNIVTTTRKVDVVGMVVDVVVEGVVTISHKPMKMPTPERTRVWLSLCL